RSAGRKAKADFTAFVNNSEHQPSPRSPLRGSPSTFDRRGARAGGSQPAPLLVLARYRTPKIIPSPRKPKHGSETTGLLRTLRCLFSVSQRVWSTATAQACFYRERGRVRDD